MSRYNVLLIISDQHKKSVAGCYGDTRVHTPALDRLAADGLTFDNAYCQAPLCGPSRTSLMTGAHPHTCNAFGHGPASTLPPDLPTLGQVFRDAGYATGSFGKVHVQGEDKQRRDLGFSERDLRYYTYRMQDYIDAIGEEKMKLYRAAKATGASSLNPTNSPIELEEELMFDNLVADRSMRFLEDHRDEPFFVWVGLEKPHPPWYAPPRYHDLYHPDDMVIPETFRDEHPDIPTILQRSNLNAQAYSDETVRNNIAAYYANVSFLDNNIGRLMSKVDELGLRDNTVIIYTSDHGENLFEHGLIQKHCLYEASVNVPLIVQHPGLARRGEREDALVSLIDLPPTMMELTGVDPPDTLEGQSIADLLRGERRAEDRPVFSEFYGVQRAQRMVRDGAWKYIYTHRDRPQLYNLDDDPLERHNLAMSPQHQARRDAMEKQVWADWDIDPDRDWTGHGLKPDKY